MFTNYLHIIFFTAATISLFKFRGAFAQHDFAANCDVVDVGLVIDSSENLGEENFENLRSFLKTFLSVVNVGQDSTRIAAVQVASEASTLWNLAESLNSEELIERIDGMDHFGGEQEIGSAFTQLTTDIFIPAHGDRPVVPDVVVIFTGGATTENNEGMAELRNLGAHVVVVTVGDDAAMQWKQYASTPAEDNFFNLDSAFHVVLLLQDPTFVLCTDDIESTILPTVTAIPTTTETIPLSPTTADMIPPHPTDIFSTSIFVDPSLPSCPQDSWTRWYNSDSPDGEGDDESLERIQSRYTGEVCEFPTEFEARVARTGRKLNLESGNVFASRLTGLECLNIFGPEDCEDYEIRFCCPQVITTPPPSIKVTRPSSLKIFTTATTEQLPPLSPTTPKPVIQKSTPVPRPASYCPPGGWTPWYNNDTPQGNGDDETLRSIRSRYPGDVCEFPTKFEARLAATGAGIDSNARNVFVTRLTGLECLNGYGEDCEDYEIRFCCPRKIRCLVGSMSTSSEGTSVNLKELECAPGDVCSDVTATVVTNNGKNITSVNSFGLCMSASKCSKFQCDSARSLFSSDVIDVLSCEAKCCENDLCNRPQKPVPSPTVPSATPGLTPEPYHRGTTCYKGIEVTGSSDPKAFGLGQTELHLVQCKLGEVCSVTAASVDLPGGYTSDVIVRRYQCLAPVACSPAKCGFMKSILSGKRGSKLMGCKSHCCDWNGCNAPAGVTSTSQPSLYTSSVAKTATPKKASTRIPIIKIVPATKKPFVVKPQPHKPRYSKDVAFLPSCTITEAVRSVLWCESLFTIPQPYEGLDTCRNQLKEAARCVAKQLSWCMTGNKFSRLDSFEFSTFNSQTMANFLDEIAWTEETSYDEDINSFCFHAGYDFNYTKPVSTRMAGCHHSFLTELREKAKSFYYTFTWARRKEDICRAHTSFKQWFIEAFATKCRFDRLSRKVYSTMATRYLDSLARIAIKEVKNHQSLSCTDMPKSG